MNYLDFPHALRDLFAILPLLAFLLFFSSAILASSLARKKLIGVLLAALLSLASLFFVYAHICYDRNEGFALALIDSLPAWLVIALDALLLVSGALMFAFLGYRKKRMLSLSSFQDAYDAMPLGVCFYDDDGTLLLTNRFLLDFSDRFMSYYLMNAKEFVRRLENGEWDGGSVPFEGGKAYQRKDGEVFVLSISDKSMEGKSVHELSLINVTELYRLTLETKRSNEELKRSNERLKKLGKEIASLKKEEENLLAKKRIHDDLGGLLLYAKSCLDKDLGEEEKEALLRYLEKEAKAAVSLEKKEIGEGLFEELRKAGEDIGVEVSFLGEEIPSDEEKFVYEASLECLLNAYRHGKARRMEVNYRKIGEGHELVIANDGSVEEGKVKEGSGLSSLRSLVENRGGTMKIDTSPKFAVTIRMFEI